MEKLRVLKYGVLLVMCLFLTGSGCPTGKMVNFYNNLTKSGSKFTAKIVCSSATYEAYTGQYSTCKPVLGPFCDCKFYADGELQGTFQGCIDVSEYCNEDGTLVLTLDGSNPTLGLICVTHCGDSITKAGVEYEDILDTIFMMEDSEVEFELYLDE